MQTTYNHDRHFLAVRDMLVETYAQFPVAFNWRLERWQYARSYVVPMLATYGDDAFELAKVHQALATWDALQGIWANDDGRVVAAVATEEAKPSDGFIMRRPEADALLPEMLIWIENRLVNEKDEAATWICEQDDTLLQAARQAGFTPQEDAIDVQSRYDLTKGVPEPRLSEGWRVCSMDEMPDIAKRREVMSRGFDHTDPREWSSDWAYRSMMQAPDYRPELDLFAVGPDGEYASSAILWYDAHNRIASLEPVSTRPDYRRRGLGREVIYEGLRRAAALGAQEAWVGSRQPFYMAIGFEQRITFQRWLKQMR